MIEEAEVDEITASIANVDTETSIYQVIQNIPFTPSNETIFPLIILSKIAPAYEDAVCKKCMKPYLAE